MYVRMLQLQLLILLMASYVLPNSSGTDCLKKVPNDFVPEVCMPINVDDS
jgi:hypothetical protein